MEEKLTIDEIIEHCKRQTEKLGKYCYKNELGEMKGLDKEYWEHKQVKEYLEELKKYRKLDEQGKMLILPVNVGDTVYVVEHRSGVCSYGQRWNLNCEYGCPYDNYSEKCDSKLEYYIKPQFINSLVDVVCIMGAVGKTVFLTEPEAEKALEGMKNE